VEGYPDCAGWGRGQARAKVAEVFTYWSSFGNAWRECGAKALPCHLPSCGPGNLGGKRYRPAWWTIGSASVSAISIATEW
jgi:hypothetical protein